MHSLMALMSVVAIEALIFSKVVSPLSLLNRGSTIDCAMAFVLINLIFQEDGSSSMVSTSP